MFYKVVECTTIILRITEWVNVSRMSRKMNKQKSQPIIFKHNGKNKHSFSLYSLVLYWGRFQLFDHLEFRPNWLASGVYQLSCLMQSPHLCWYTRGSPIVVLPLPFFYWQPKLEPMRSLILCSTLAFLVLSAVTPFPVDLLLWYLHPTDAPKRKFTWCKWHSYG